MLPSLSEKNNEISHDKNHRESKPSENPKGSQPF